MTIGVRQISVPASPGAGPAVDISGLDPSLLTLIYTSGNIDGVRFELSDNNVNFAQHPELYFYGSDVRSRAFAATFIRAFRERGTGGSPIAYIGGDTRQDQPPAATRAGLAARAGQVPGSGVYVAEVDGVYESVAPGPVHDGWTVIVAGDGAVAWLLRSARIAVSPLGANDSARLNSLFAAAAGKLPVHLRPGNYDIEARLEPADNSDVIQEKGAVLVSRIAPSGGGDPVNAVVFRVPPAPAWSTTLADPAVIGQDTIRVANAGAIAIGNEFAIARDNHVRPYNVKNVNPGTGVVTLDRALAYEFIAGTTVQERRRPKNIRWRGFKATGTGDIAVEISGGDNILFEDVDISGSFVLGGFNYDVGSINCVILRGIIDTPNAITCCNLESGEHCVAEGLWLRRATLACMFVTYGYDTTVSRCAMWGGAAAGLVITGDSGGGGARNVFVDRCVFVDNGGIGLDIQNGSHRVYVSQCEAYLNTGTGFAVNAGAGGTSKDVMFANCMAISNGAAGFVVAAGCTGVLFANCTSDLNTLEGLICSGQAVVHGFYSRTCGVGGITAAGAADLVVDGATLARTTAGVWNGLALQGTSRVRLSRATITAGGGGGTKVGISNQATCIAHIDNVRAVGADFGYASGANGTLRQGDGVDFSGCTTPYLTGAGTGYFSFGETALNGATPVNVAFPDAKAVDRAMLRAARRVAGGTPGHFSLDIDPGVGVVLTGQAGDTSTVAWGF